MLRMFLKEKDHTDLPSHVLGKRYYFVFVDLFIDKIKLTRGPTRLKVRLPRMHAQDGDKL